MVDITGRKPHTVVDSASLKAHTLLDNTSKNPHTMVDSVSQNPHKMVDSTVRIPCTVVDSNGQKPHGVVDSTGEKYMVSINISKIVGQKHIYIYICMYMYASNNTISFISFIVITERVQYTYMINLKHLNHLLPVINNNNLKCLTDSLVMLHIKHLASGQDAMS